VITDEKDLRIAILEARVAELEKLVLELTEKLNRNSQNSSKPPSSDQPWKKPKPKFSFGKKRKKGGQPGHPKNERELVPAEQVDAAVPVKPERCRCCGLPLAGDDPQPHRHQVFDIPKIRARCTEFQLHALTCDCGAVTRASLPSGVPRGAFGPSLVALVCLLTGKFRLSKRALKEFMGDVLGTEVALGSVANIEQQMSAALEAPVCEARAFVREQPVTNMDETGWREDNKRAWLWTVVTPLVTVFHVVRSRAAKVAKDLLGENFAGQVGCDRWKSYDWIPAARRQLCWAHLIRDFTAMTERTGYGRIIGRKLLKKSKRMFGLWWKARDGTLSWAEFQRKMRPIEAEVGRLLRAGLSCRTTKTAATCKDILRNEQALWTFVRIAGVEPTNNAAERALRPAVLWRKQSFGTQSEAGSRFAERILTAVATLKAQRRHVLSYLTEAIEAHNRGRLAASLLPPAQQLTVVGVG
jgi:transposase